MDIQLTEHFKLSEFIKSSYISAMPAGPIKRWYLAQQNLLNYDIFMSVFMLANRVLQPARYLLGECIHVNSGYRCNKLNSAVGGVEGSQHLLGLAADVTCDDNAKLYDILFNLDFDQLICYGPRENPRFIHVSYVSSQVNRHQVIFKK